MKAEIKINLMMLLPEEIFSIFASFLAYRYVARLAITDKSNSEKLKTNLNSSTPKIIFDMTLRELCTLMLKGPRSVEDQKTQKIIKKMIKNIIVTGKIYNQENSKIFSGLKRNSAFDNLYADAKTLAQNCPHIILFIMNSFNSYGYGFRRYCGKQRIEEMILNLYFFLEKHKDYSENIELDALTRDYINNEVDVALQRLYNFFIQEHKEPHDGYLDALIRIFTVFFYNRNYFKLKFFLPSFSLEFHAQLDFFNNLDNSLH